MKKLIYISLLLPLLAWSQADVSSTVINGGIIGYQTGDDVPEVVTGLVFNTVIKDADTRGKKDIWWGNGGAVPPSAGTGSGRTFLNDTWRNNFEQAGLSDAIIQSGNCIEVTLDPRASPAPVSTKYNFRVEILELPWNTDSKVAGTEEWLGWSTYYPSDWVRDIDEPSVFWQNMKSSSGTGNGPIAHLQISHTNNSYSASTGEITFIEKTSNEGTTNRYNTGVIVAASTRIDHVVHIVWEGDGAGQFEYWANATQEIDLQNVRTTRAVDNVGGNNKFGDYSAGKKNESTVLATEAGGKTENRYFMSPIRFNTRGPSDPAIVNGYNDVTTENVIMTFNDNGTQTTINPN